MPRKKKKRKSTSSTSSGLRLSSPRRRKKERYISDDLEDGIEFGFAAADAVCDLLDVFLKFF